MISILRMQKLLDVFQSFDVQLVLVGRAQFHQLISEIFRDASVVEHVHEEVVEIAVDDSGAGDVLRGRFISAPVVDVELFDLERILLFGLLGGGWNLREGAQESKRLSLST